jgi:hypothetical protein
MSFYGGRGDFYRGQGDPGHFDFLKKGVSTAFHFLAPRPISAAVDVGTALVRKTRENVAIKREQMAGRTVGLGPFRHVVPFPGGGAVMQRGAEALQRGAKGRKVVTTPSGVPTFAGLRHHRHMNVANVKALHRAVRRLLGFKKLATKVESSLMKLARRHHYRPSLPPAPARRRLGRGRGDMMLGDFYQGDG